MGANQVTAHFVWAANEPYLIEKCVAFCPYRIDGRLPGADKILLARAPHNLPPEMSMEESLGAIPITLLFDSFCVYHLFSNC